MTVQATTLATLARLDPVAVVAWLAVIVMLTVVLVKVSPERRPRRLGRRPRGRRVAVPGGDGTEEVPARRAVDARPERPVETASDRARSATVEVLGTEETAPGTRDPAVHAPVERVVAPFVDVARRDQGLLNRQLELLDSLERSEDDPEVLMNLFRLDNLAARMRRNAESLLVLADAEPSRRVRSPMPLSDVLRTASSQIEHYDRVVLDLADDPTVLGHHVLSIAHLLAELLENATVYSDPTSVVEITGGAPADPTLLTIVDSGLGMGPADVAQSNQRVACPQAARETGLQRLGLSVVGHLAARVGATVSFRTRDGATGTEVTVGLPASVFTTAVGTAASSGVGRSSSPLQQDGLPPSERQTPPAVAVVAPDRAPVVPPGATVSPAELFGVPAGLAAAIQASVASFPSPPQDPAGMPPGFDGVPGADPRTSPGAAPAAGAPLPVRPVPEAVPRPEASGDWTAPSVAGPVEQAVLFDIGHLSERLAWMRAVEVALLHDGQPSAEYEPSSHLIGTPAPLARRVPQESARDTLAPWGAAAPTARAVDALPVVSQDAHHVRARLSSFQSATVRGREHAVDGLARPYASDGTHHP